MCPLSTAVTRFYIYFLIFFFEISFVIFQLVGVFSHTDVLRLNFFEMLNTTMDEIMTDLQMVRVYLRLFCHHHLLVGRIELCWI